jgi:hypothetical protein
VCFNAVCFNNAARRLVCLAAGHAQRLSADLALWCQVQAARTAQLAVDTLAARDTLRASLLHRDVVRGV